MRNNEWGAIQPVAADQVRKRWSVNVVLLASIQLLRTYWWWVPLLLLSMLVGGAVAYHHKVKVPTEAKPTLLVKKKGNPLARPA